MPQYIDYEPLRDEITQLYKGGYTVPAIVKAFEDRGVKLSQRTLERRLQTWGVPKYNKRLDYEDELLRCRVAILFYQFAFKDADIIFALEQEGYEVTERALKRLRGQLGLNRKVDLKNLDAENERLREIVQDELHKGTIATYGRGLLYYHFRLRHHNVAR